MPELEEIISEFKRALLNLDRVAARDILTRASVVCAPVRLADALITPSLEQIGAEFEEGKLALSQVYMGGRICEEVVDSVLPPGSLIRRNQPEIGIATLEDYHALGKKIVSAILRSTGFELIDYGVGVGAEDLADWIKKDNIKIILVSVLMLPAALRVRDLQSKLNGLGLETVKVLVGGAPFKLDKRLWEEVGADAVGLSASEAIKVVSDMVEEIV